MSDKPKPRTVDEVVEDYQARKQKVIRVEYVRDLTEDEWLLALRRVRGGRPPKYNNPDTEARFLEDVERCRAEIAAEKKCAVGAVKTIDALRRLKKKSLEEFGKIEMKTLQNRHSEALRSLSLKR